MHNYVIYSKLLIMALHPIFYGVVSTLLTYSSLIHTLHGSGQVSPTNSSIQQVNHVTPNKSMPCLTDQHPCFTIDEYASQIDKFFFNDSIFSFLSGNHRLNIGLKISGIHNVSFIGLPDNSVTIMVLNKSTSITWEGCKCIEITNITIIIKRNFTYVISFESTFLVELTNITILGNGHTGCSSIISNRSAINICNSKFKGIKGYSGAALLASESNITFAGINLFLKNKAVAGGAVYFYQNSTVLFSGINVFCNNSASYYNNSTCTYCLSFSKLDMQEIFFRNESGGAIGCDNSTITLSSCVISLNETISRLHVIVDDISDVLSINNSSFVYLVNNSAYRFGGAINLIRSTLQVCGSVFLLKNNSAYFGGAIHTRRSNISIGTNCSTDSFSKSIVTLEGNRATYRGAAIGSHSTNLYFNGNISFSNNTADYGGAMMLRENSRLSFKSDIVLHFIRNVANKKGGALYYDARSTCNCEYMSEECFISFDSLNNTSVLINFVNNSAHSAGAVLYSGELDECSSIYPGRIKSLDDCYVKIGQQYESNLYAVLENASTITDDKKREMIFSADTKYINFCANQKSDVIDIYPGKQFKIALIASASSNCNQKLVHTRTEIFSKINDPNDGDMIKLILVNSRSITNNCTNISYYLTATNTTNQSKVSFKLYHDNPCGIRKDQDVTLSLHIRSCPLGFQLSNKHKVCVCDKRIQRFTDKCDINNLSIQREKNSFWVSKCANDNGLILHDRRCPFDFCKVQSLNVSLSNPSIQCDFNRNGTLCGQCNNHYSLALGTLHCLYCANSRYITLVIPFALVGIALVMVILLLHLTVDVGTLNGLIFYANIVHSNREAYFQHTREITNFHAIILSWLNLDFGIEICFYDGMDIYTYSWLQFLFPFYLWFLIVAIIFICHYSQRISKSLGRNPVAALGTVLFLSYGKILNAIIAPLSKTELTFANDTSFSIRSVWLYDGSVEYFAELKHIVLGLFAILILLLAFVPYTLILLCGHWLIAYSDKCFLSWLNKIKPVLDVYYAPFKHEARYWIGLSLLARLALLLTIAINAVGSDSVNLLVIASVTAGLLSIKGRVYELRYNDILESSFILNLCIFSVATLYLKDKNIESQPAILSASVGISFVIFIGILFFHIFLLLKSKNVWKHDIVVINSLLRKNWLLCKLFIMVPKEDENVVPNSNNPKVVTSTLVELREPLIDNDEV